MTRKMTFALLTAALVALPLAAAAQDHGSHGKKKDHGTHSHADHSAAHDAMIMIGEQSVEGVEGMAHINDIREAMTRMKMKETHHFIMMFVNEATHQAIETGTAALKITDPAGREGDAVRLIAMDGHFGADVILGEPGEYRFKVGTRLPDGKTRQFDYTYKLD